MKGKVFLKRPKVDWYGLFLELGDPDVDYYYWVVLMHNPNIRKMSHNRRFYMALLHVYGKARLDAYRYSGVWTYGC